MISERHLLFQCNIRLLVSDVLSLGITRHAVLYRLPIEHTQAFFVELFCGEREFEMGKGGRGIENGRVKELTWDEIGTHDKKDDSWLVIKGKVYNVTNFMKKHPGGARIISSYGGQDATVNVFAVFVKNNY